MEKRRLLRLLLLHNDNDNDNEKEGEHIHEAHRVGVIGADLLIDLQMYCARTTPITEKNIEFF